MKKEFKVGDKVKCVNVKDAPALTLGGKYTIRDLYVDEMVLLKGISGYAFDSYHFKHLKPKLTEKRVLEIVRDEIGTQAKKLERIDKALIIAESATNAVNNLKDLAQRMPIPNWGGEGVKCEPQKPKSGWYKSPSWRDYLFYFDFEECTSYGIGILNYWEDLKDMNYFEDTDIPATNEEVITRLVDYIKNNLNK
jgi:hypothetical protein